MSDDLVIYHGKCFDGITAAWVVDRYFALHHFPRPEYFAGLYGQAPPDTTGKKVVIVDFSYPRQVLMEMAQKSSSFLVLDHHKTAQADLEGLSYAVFNMDKSGAGLAWDWFFAGHPRHWLVDAVEDRDLWKFRLPDTKDIHGYLAGLDMTLTEWWKVSELDRGWVASQGAAVLGYIESYGKKAIDHVFYVSLMGTLFPCINVSYQNCSDHLDQMLRREGVAPVAASVYYSGEDQKWHFSLRSRGDVDISIVAKFFGGGGHKNAAGFVMTSEMFIHLLTDKFLLDGSTIKEEK